MFQSLRTGTPFYVLNKIEPKLMIGEVVSVGLPVPQFGATFQNGIMAAPKNTVDVKVKLDGKDVDFQKLPAEVCIADFGDSGMVVSESKDAVLAEIESMRTISQRAIEELPKHEAIVAESGRMIAALNPSVAREAEQAREIESLKSELSDIKAMLSKALGHDSKED